ncbi:MAG: flagellar basal body P-ring formation protein FlgA [Roseicyclus sp.]|uniref:flagellar basal body P-ring formation chaperone FlgA n=1 Tax=Boseongicola sp. H5 TaxID=2763261 RepID=UPI001B2D6FF9|nr:flagellar basal body P-ring formation chaperone FlgA [Boseongicola sp. H5]MBO6603372.1 flagellar basal body P-ring formation protein FlgA [Roseicyclus sp.]MBO6625054.1 flagellar basal body P-ring formation protein FlgA [Roseicyclus sp.]MBO6923555.1 flagellar basal body P-ring formation protein FlgA [Roseicyclus sp.]
MIRFLLILFLLGLTGQAWSQTLVANGTIRSQTIIGPADVRLAEGNVPGAITDPVSAIGMEARVNLYPGRPIRPSDLRAPAVVDRNEIVTLQYNQNGLLIVTEGRALERGGVGDRLRVLNLASRNTITGTVLSPGLVGVGHLQ